ncbi:MAG: sulfite exporter TauE/SafE family protein [Flavobacteriales bacterium]
MPAHDFDWPQLTGLIALGFGVGAIGTLIGAGGGFILLPVLLLLFPDMGPGTLTAISLGVVFINASSGSIAYARLKRIDYRSGIQFALAGLPGALIGAYLTSYIPRRLFDVVLGVLLIAIAVFLLMRPHYQRKAAAENSRFRATRSLTDDQGHTYGYAFSWLTGVLLSFVVGFVSSLLGIGGGIIHVPILTTLLHFPVPIATATSHFILAIMALAGTIVHVARGDLHNGWHTLLAIGGGIVVGAQVGAYWSHRMQPHWIVRALALALLLVGVRIIFA